MSLRIDLVDWIAESLVIGNTGLGYLGSTIPSSGDNGASFLYNDLDLPTDNNKEIRALILTYPSAGTLTVYEDGSFSFTGAPDGTYYFTYSLYVDGVLTGDPATVTLNIGSALSATGAVVSTCTATLSTGIMLVASPVSVVTATSSLISSIPLNSTAESTSTSTSDLTTGISLNCVILTQSSASAELTVFEGTIAYVPGASCAATAGTINVITDSNAIIAGATMTSSAGNMIATSGIVVDSSVDVVGATANSTAGVVVGRVRDQRSSFGFHFNRNIF